MLLLLPADSAALPVAVLDGGDDDDDVLPLVADLRGVPVADRSPSFPDVVGSREIARLPLPPPLF